MTDNPKPQPNSIWRHHSGRLYRVLFIANDTDHPRDGYPPTVVYEGVDNGRRWSGPLSDWHRRMTLNEMAQPKSSDLGLLIRDMIEEKEFKLFDLGGDEVDEIGDDMVTTVNVSDADNPVIHTESGRMFRLSIMRIG